MTDTNSYWLQVSIELTVQLTLSRGKDGKGKTNNAMNNGYD